MLQAGRIPNQESILSLLVRTSIGKEKLKKFALQTQMYRTVFWTLWERERVG